MFTPLPAFRSSLPSRGVRAVLTTGTLLGLVGGAGAASLVWNGTTSNDWGTATNWTPNAVPNLDGTDTATIANGDSVDYPADSLGDINIRPGSSVTVSGGSALVQTTTFWTQFNGGAMTLDNGTFQRTAAGNVVLGFQADTTNTLSLSNGGLLDIGGELWFGHNTNTGNQLSTITMDDSAIATRGTVGIWFWDTDSAGNDFTLDFVPGAVSTITVADRIGRRNAAETNNVIEWETLWNEGLLSVNGSTTGAFSDFFTTSGTSAADGTAYTLTFTGVPEPGTPLFLAAALSFLGLQRKRRV